MIVDPPTGEVPLPAELGRVHLLGIGGEGMARVGKLMLDRGVPTSGCDSQESAAVHELRALGVPVAQGNSPAHLDTADTLVTSSAVRTANPELAAAGARGTRVLHRAAALASLMRGYRSAAVSGTHGKTTTTGMLAAALRTAGRDPSYALGAELAATGTAAHVGGGDVFVVEADESDASFTWFRSDVAVVTNVDADHLENFGTATAYAAAFHGFVDAVLPGGRFVACADDAGSAATAAYARGRATAVTTYGEAADADLRLVDLRLAGTGSRCTVVLEGEPLGTLVLQVPGRYNALNAAGALAAGVALGVPAAPLLDGLAAFTGTRRRFEAKGSAAGVAVYDDYAHHPVELEAVLRAAREVAGGGRVVVVFQPKRYSRTRFFAAEFSDALALADVAVVTDVYAHLEDPEEGVDGALIASAVPLPAGSVVYEPSWPDTPATVAALVQPGDLVLTVGGGDAVASLGPQVLALLGGAR